MSEIRDNWERLVSKVLDREELRRLCYASSRSPSISSEASSFSTSTFTSRLEFDHAKFTNSEVKRTANLVHEPERIGHQQAPGEYVRNIGRRDGAEEVTTDSSTAQINWMLTLRQLNLDPSRSPSRSSESSSFSTSTFLSRLDAEVDRTVNLVNEPERIGHQHAPREYVRNIACRDGSDEVAADSSTAQINRMLEKLRQLNLDPSRSPSISSESSSFNTSSFFSRLEFDHGELTNSEIPRTANRVHDQTERIVQQRAPCESVRNIARRDRSRDVITDHKNSAHITRRMWEVLPQLSHDLSRSPSISPSETPSSSTSSSRIHLDFDDDTKSAYSSEVKRTANLVDPERIGRDASGDGDFIKYRGQKEETKNEGEKAVEAGEKKAAKGGVKKAEDGGGKKDAEPIAVVLKLDLHCEGCAKNVRSFISHLEGVERVTADCDANKVTVTGNVDPAWLREQVEIKTKKKLELMSPSEAGVSTVVMKIRLHCDGCVDKIRRIISRKINGVNSVTMDLQKDLVTVVGTMDAEDLSMYLEEKLKRNVEIITPKKVDDGGGEKKEKESGGDKKEKEEGGGGGGEDTAGGEKKGKEGSGGGGDEKKEGAGDKRVGELKPPEGGGGEGTKIEVNKMEYLGLGPRVYNAARVPIYYTYLDTIDGMFSDENPNGCFVM